MSATDSPFVPQPTPVLANPPEPPPQLTPSPLRALAQSPAGVPELAVLLRMAWVIRDDGTCHYADEQPPLDEDGKTYDPVAEGRPASFSSLPELIGYKSGTDVVIRAHARPQRPVTHMAVGAVIGDHRHAALVFGDRKVDVRSGEIRFTDPEPFDEIPLRYEFAYGGGDAAYQARLVEEIRARMSKDALRRTAALAETFFAETNPLLYPRNRFGLGLVLDDRPEAMQGRALPNLERMDDRLTPERLVLPDPTHWLRQPVPVGFDYLEPIAYPRSAMFAMSPDMSGDPNPPEVVLGLVAPGFWRGNLWDGPMATIPQRVNPECTRSASLGLCLPFVSPGTAVTLHGMDPHQPAFTFTLPRDVPLFSVGHPSVAAADVAPQLYLIHIDVDARLLSLVWTARMRLRRSITQFDMQDVESSIGVRYVSG
jgi:Uncharacterized protein conserved in bacteria (DUF2169)